MRMLAMCIAATALTLPVAAGFATSHDAPPTITEWFALTAPVEEVDAAPEGLPSTRTRIDASDVAVAPDGTMLVADFLGVVRRVDADGIVTDVAGRNPARTRSATTQALRTELNNPTAIAALPDGGFYVSDPFEKKVRRVGPDGRVRTFARLLADDIAVMPDGGFVATDWLNDRVRRVLPDGSVTRYAGTGHYGLRGDGGPARRARLASPGAVASLPDGSVLIADTSNDRVRRVDPTGTIDTLAKVPSPEGIAHTGDGGFVVVGGIQERLWRFDADGTPRGSIAPAPDFADRGPYDGGDLAVLPDGSLVMAADRLWMTDGGTSPLPAVAIRDLVISDGSIDATISATRPGIAILGAGVAEVRTAVEAGASHVVLREGVGAGWYDVEVLLSAGVGRGADSVRAFTGTVLPVEVARSLVARLLDDNQIVGHVGRCRRADGRHVVCVVRSRTRCRFRLDVALPTSGIPSHRRLGCSRQT